MIGIIGPDDSVGLATRVATELGLDDSILTRAYDTADEAPGLAAELDSVCNVLLFTGRAPYTLARRAGGLRAILDFVPHSGADLYRTLVLVLRDHEGRLPVVSLDTIERSTVVETYQDLGLEPPVHVLALETEDDEPGIRSASDVTTFHLERYRQREVELCLTCLGSVRLELNRLGVPVVRIEHTRAALRDALTRAALTARLARSEATQIAIALVDASGLRNRLASATTPYEAKRLELRAQRQVLDLAERLQGAVIDGTDHTFLIHTTRGAVEGEIARLRGSLMPTLEGSPGETLLIGFGVGQTVASAEGNARQALALGRHSGEIHVVLVDGSILRVGRDRIETGYRLRETDPRLLARAREVGLGSLTLARLLAALRDLDPNALTARDLAHAYGVAPRSARRLLSSLQRAGVATTLGTQVAPRAGRPQTVFRVDVDRLLPRA